MKTIFTQIMNQKNVLPSSSSRPLKFFLLTISLSLLIGCSQSSTPETKPKSDADTAGSTGSNSSEVTSSAADNLLTTAVSPSEDEKPLLYFREVSHELGIPVSKAHWPDGKYFTPEITPGGVALFDYNNDGRLDIYLICHAPSEDPPHAFQGQSPNRLFQQLADGSFQEIPGAAGLNDPGFGHGVAVGDIDNDGDLDVFVTNYGANRLYQNSGEGTFTDITAKSGVDGDQWSSAASFFDYDRDGDLDLMVINFATFDYNKHCSPSGQDDDLDYCGPHEFAGLIDSLYRNDGDGKFSDVTAELGIDTPARGWGVLTVDMTGDGLVDIYVANDEEPNQLWVQQEDGTFLDEAVWRGCAFNSAGKVEASMGVTYGDINADNKMDLFMTHVTLETNTLYVSRGEDNLFDDASTKSGMGSDDRPYTGWGCGFLDFDHDGDLDLAVANGRVAKGVVSKQAQIGEFWSHYGEQNFLFQNDGLGHFAKLSDQGGGFSSAIEVTRGLAFGDIDNDGDMDMVSNNIDNTLRIYQNVAPKKDTHWLMVRAMTGKRDAVGARIELQGVPGRHSGFVMPSYSYLASNDPRVHFGLGNSTHVESLVVDWPDGKKEQFEVPKVDQHMVVVQGEGMPSTQ